jgi:hypothetical protein
MERFGLILFIFINLVISFIVHYNVKNLLLAAFISSPIAITILLLMDNLLAGYLDPFIIFSFFIGWFYCFLFALAMGIPFGLIRKRDGKERRRKKKKNNSG